MHRNDSSMHPYVSTQAVMKKVATWLITVIVIAGLVALCIVRWNAWFGNVPEHDYVVDSYPHNLALTFGNDAATQRRLTWRSSRYDTLAYVIVSRQADKADTIRAYCTPLTTRAGNAVFYRADIEHLKPGTYTVRAYTANLSSEPMLFTVSPIRNKGRFVVMGDVQTSDEQFATHIFDAAQSAISSADFVCQVGDLIERPTDSYWQLFFSTWQRTDTLYPMVFATGNHEYLKGVRKTLDNRWTHIFANPENGPIRALGRTYYIDFDNLRFVVIDTDQLQLFSDYTRTATWLEKVLTDADATNKWKVVMMHHPVYSAGMNRANPLIYLTFKYQLRNADLILAGHDHNYARRLINKTHGDHVTQGASYVLGSSDKYYLGKISNYDDRILSGHPVIAVVNYNRDSMTIDTYQTDIQQLYDRVTLRRDTTAVDYFSKAKETIDKPKRYEQKNTRDTKKFDQRRQKRLNRTA